MSKITLENLQEQIDKLIKEIAAINSFNDETRKYILDRMGKESPLKVIRKPFKGIIKSKIP